MSNYDKYEEEINILTLLWFVLSKWRSILIVAIIGLALGAGYAVVSAPSNSGEATEQDTSTETVKDVEYIIKEQAYETTLSRVESLEQYIAEAAIMKMNPYELYKGTVTYVIDDTYKDLAGLNTAIYSFVWDGALMAEIEKVGPYTTTELDYLVGLSQGLSSQTMVDENAIGQATARISICAQDKKEAQKLLALVDASVSAYLDELLGEQDIAGYKLISTDMRETMSTAVADYQTNMRDKYETEKASLDTYKANVEAMPSIVAVEDGSINKTTLIKYGAVGFVGGIVVAAVFWILIYFMCGRLYTVSDKERRFGVKQLGTIHDYSKLKGVDLFIEHKVGGVYSDLQIEEQRNIVLMNIMNALEQEDSIDTIFLASSLDESMEELCLLKADLESNKYNVLGIGNVVGNADKLQLLSKADAVVIIEDYYYSKTQLIEKEVAVLNEYVNKIIGMVVLHNKK